MPALSVEEAKGRMHKLNLEYCKQRRLRQNAEEMAKEFTPGTSLHQVMKACASQERELEGKYLGLKACLRLALEPPAPAHPCPDHGGGELCLNLDNPALKCAPELCPVQLYVTKAGATALAGR